MKAGSQLSGLYFQLQQDLRLSSPGGAVDPFLDPSACLHSTDDSIS